MDNPNIFQKAKNFTKAVFDHLVSGWDEASPELQQARLAICAQCPLRTPDNTCSKCGCNLDLKTSWAEQTCPEDKW